MLYRFLQICELWKAPIFPDLQMTVSAFLSDKLGSRKNLPVRYGKTQKILN